MAPDPSLLLILDLLGTFAFALNGALTAVRSARLDIVGVLTLGAITAVGGGIIRDVLLGALPPATILDWRYLAVATAGGLVAFLFIRGLQRLTTPILVLDAAGLGLFAVTGAGKALEFGVGPGQAVLLGVITAVGGGTLRDIVTRQVPTVLSSGLYAVPALLGAGIVVLSTLLAPTAVLPVAAVVAAAACFALRMVGLRFRWNAPQPRGFDDPTPDSDI